jgi:signal transduction histidine kinase
MDDPDGYFGARVAALDGTLQLDSPPGAGTRLRAEIPL